MTEQTGNLIRKHAYVSGIVQGVGFRWFVERVANFRGLDGWVRNLPDGRVELEVEGPLSAVDDFLDEVGRGPFSGRVDKVVATMKPVEGTIGFRIRF